MKKKYFIIGLGLLFVSSALKAQTLAAPARIGQYGFSQLLINSWAKSSGMGNSYSAAVGGVESFHLNPAGLGKVKKTDVAFSYTSWLGGTGININSFGLAQRVGVTDEKLGGVIALSVTSFSLGQINITTPDQPEGGIGTYKPSISNINLAYAHNFSERISAGINVKLASESTPDVRTSAIAFDAGLQFADQLKSGNKLKFQNESDNPAAGRGSDIHFGVSIKNLGTDVRYSGDGLATKSNIDGKPFTTTTSQRSDKVALPSLINIGMAYDFRLDNNNETYWHRLTPAITFTKNEAMSNQTAIGAEYAFKEILMLRAGYNYEKGIFKYETRNNAFTGLNIGTTFQIPLKDKDNKRIANLGFDYSYRATRPFSGTHSIGLRVTLF